MAARLYAQDPAPPGKLLDLTQKLKGRFPSRSSIEEHGAEVSGALLTFIKAHAEDEDKALEVSEARLLLAEVYLLVGSSREGRELIQEVTRSGGAADDRARALYLLGEQLFFRERFVEESGGGKRARANAYQYWNVLEGAMPDSPWANRVARPLRYLRLLQGAPLSPFEERFRSATGEVQHSLETLRGKLVVIDFWMGSTPGQRDFEAELKKRVEEAQRGHLGSREGLIVLGVNLDRSAASFERAVKDWALPWPQHHDGLGFKTALAERFGIPRLPHRLLLDGSGRVVHLGADRTAFFQGLAAEIEKARG